MSKELDATISYGFVLDVTTRYDELPAGLIEVMESDGNPYCNSSERSFDLTGAIRCLIQKRQPMLEADLLEMGEGNKIVVYIRSTSRTATNEIKSIGELTITEIEQANIGILASLCDTQPTWLFYPTYF